MAYFPMFVNIENKPCLVAGGGSTALRKIHNIMDFGGRVTVVAPCICPEIKMIQGLKLEEREFADNDIDGFFIVIAATDNDEVNTNISRLCLEHNIPVNVVDRKEECSFIFPAYTKKENVVAAFSTGGNSPVIAQYLKESSEKYLTDLVGELAESLGSIRDMVKATANPKIRKKIYSSVFNEGIKLGRVPSKEEIEEIIKGCMDKER